MRTIDLLCSALTCCERNGVEIVPFTQGVNLPGTRRPLETSVPPHKHGSECDCATKLVWNDRHSTTTLMADLEPEVFQKQLHGILDEMREYLKALDRRPEESAPMPLASYGFCDLVPLKIDGFWVRAIMGYSHMHQALMLTLDCLFPEKVPEEQASWRDRKPLL